MKTVSASDANRHFSRVIKEVSRGEVVTVVSRGKAVANISPPEVGGDGRKDAHQCLVERLRQQKISGQRGWTRESLYDRAL